MMNKILVEILGDHYDTINAEIKVGKLEGMISPSLHNNFDSWVYSKEEYRFQLRKNIHPTEGGFPNLKLMVSKLYVEARKYAEPRHLNCLSNIECFEFSDTQGAYVLAGSQSCNYISFFGFKMGH